MVGFDCANVGLDFVFYFLICVGLYIINCVCQPFYRIWGKVLSPRRLIRPVFSFFGVAIPASGRKGLVG